MMMKIFQHYLRYVLWIMIIAFFSFIFQIIYSSDGRNLLLTIFIAVSLGAAMYATR